MTTFDQNAFDSFVDEQGVYGFFDEAVTLKSGRQSHFYANWRTVVEDAWLTHRLADFVLAFINERLPSTDTIYGVPEGATKLGVICQYTLAQRASTFGAGSHVLAMGRAKPKEHGAPRDRYFVGTPRGRTVVLEDVTTTGGSSLTTIKFLQEAGVNVVGLVSLTSRMEKRDDGRSVAEAASALGVPFHAMSSALVHLPRLYAKVHPGETVARAIESEFATYGVEPLTLVS